MNNQIIGTIAAGLLAAVPAFAGLNPARPGLPAANAWAVTGIANNQSSAMCVDCHNANPLENRTAARYTTWQTSHNAFKGTHYVGLATNSGGGITAATPPLTPRVNSQYFMLGNWDGRTGQVSKYGTSDAPYTSYVTDGTLIRNATVDTGAGGSFDTREIICESCHSIVVNEAGGRNLLGGAVYLPANSTTGKVTGTTAVGTAFCEGCHGDMTRADAPANNEVDGSNHHVVNMVNAVTLPNQITDAKANNQLLWAPGRTATGPDRAMSTAPAYGTIEEQEIAYRILGSWVGGVAVKQAGGLFNCSDCHAFGHGGRTDTGARILRSGRTTEVGYNTGTGIDRLETMIVRNDTSGALTVFRNDAGYCNGCHGYVAK